MYFENRKKNEWRRGAVAILMVFIMTVLLSLMVFTVDLCRLYIVKSQLQNATDSGAMAGGSQLREILDGIAAANNYSWDDDDISIDNSDRQTIEDRVSEFLLQNGAGYGGSQSDFEIETQVGFWSEGDGFTQTNDSPNAITVVCVKKNEPVIFAKIFDRDVFDIYSETLLVISESQTSFVE
ncbi:Tad domain-containing protein [Mariniblastus sp.]|jgi:Flp pilus assembly protein TadG|nr:Tad domain-containing protein [Mariniblastus sp.]MDB4671800.1 Tad domain-containing protein [Pirellulaceae bacterium]MDB4756391.1 Tad domain-containing protein [Mariniblastus sp.]